MIHEKAGDGDFVDGALFGVVWEVGVFWGSTFVGFSGDPDHAFGWFWVVGGNGGFFFFEGWRVSEEIAAEENEREKFFHEAWFVGGDHLLTSQAMTKFRPCIDLHEGKVKQIVGGSLSEDGAQENYVSKRKPGWYAEKFAGDDLRGGHVIQLGPGNREAALEALGVWPGGLQIGGGISLENAKEWLEAGASEVIVTSWFFDETGKFLEERAQLLADEVGADRVVIDLSCRRVDEGWRVAMNRWQTVTEVEVSLETLEWLAGYCGEFLVHAADVEGKCGGVDEELVGLLGQWEGCRVTYAGGVRGMEDLKLIEGSSGGRLDATVGSALDLFGGNGVTYEELLEWNER